ncbi:MAG: hypothetical protein KFF77_08975 [Bacteroidetes bacterium]|nr:hypothetical protein [Bacteroidota bacterium]
MFERTIEEAIIYFTRETIADAATISSRTILDSDLPPALKRMFEVDIDLLVEEEKKRLMASPRFLYEDDDVRAVLDSLGDKARDCAQFSAEEFGEALGRNVKLLFNHVCRPQWTLVHYLFADRENASAHEIVDALQSFWYYEYFAIILREYFEQKNIAVINVRKFTDLVERIDHEVIRSFDSRKTAHLAEPLFELFNVGRNTEEATAPAEDPSVPVEALSMFFDDKNLAAIVERLDRERASRERITLHELVMIIGEADFTIGLDISTIINEQLNMGGMKKERDVTAGQDFDIPNLPEEVGDGTHHGDLGHEDDSLDFIISEEEQGVIMQDHDDATKPLEDDLNDDVEVHDMLIDDDEQIPGTETDGVEEDADSGTVYPFTENADDDDASGEAYADEADTAEADTAEAGADDDYGDSQSGYTDEGILDIEKELESLSTSMSSLGDDTRWTARDTENVDQENESTRSADADPDEIPDVILADDGDQPTKQFLESKDDIPDISLDEFESLNLGVDTDQQDPYAIDLDDEPFLSATLDDDEDVIEQNPVRVPGADLTDEEIDWEKEAEDMDDIDLDDMEEEEETLSAAIPGEEKILDQGDELPGAEELLSQLDLDEIDDKTPVVKKTQFDIPVVEDEIPPMTKAALSEQDMPEEEDAPLEDVIKEFGDLKQLIPDSDKKKYVRKMFQKDEEAFSRALQVLNGKSSWRKASEYIDELFIKFDVDMYSRIAVKFTDDIYKRYANKK